MTTQLAKLLIEAFRTFTHYNCHIQGMVADNLIADVQGENIPNSGDSFKSTSHLYHNKFEKIIREIEILELKEDVE